MMVKAVLDIKKGRGICISYVEPSLPEMVRRGKIWRRIGMPCDCLKRRRETDADERQASLKRRGDEDMGFSDGGGQCNTVS